MLSTSMLVNKQKLSSLVKKIPKYFWILLAIVVVGIFLRTYHLHDWLHFGSDQARDAILVDRVIRGDVSWPKLGVDASNTHFKLGPMYYYFQIVSRELFGNDPAVMAYPDVFFSILAIPLLFFLLRKYFNPDITLVLTGLYTVSFYVIEYSRFAWNTNPMPFFVMLFLYSILKLLEDREKTRLIWVVLFGVAVGVGVQLHTILLLLFPSIFIMISFYLLRSNWRVWNKLALALVIALLLNAGQIQSEIETKGANTHFFISALTDRSGSGTGRFWTSLETDILDHAEANSHILSSLGDKANFTFRSILYHPEKTKNHVLYAIYVGGIILSLGFSLLGYGRLGYLAWKEKDVRKKQFLCLILLFVSLSFLIMFSIARGMPLRYFIFLNIIPFILFGLLMDWLRKRSPKQFVVISTFVVVLLCVTNGNALRVEAKDLASGMRGDSGYLVLGETERMVDYMVLRSVPERKAIFFGSTNYSVTYYKSLMYLAEKRGFKLSLTDRKSIPVSDVSYFFISKDLESMDSFEIPRYDLVENKNFGKIGIYQLKKH